MRKITLLVVASLAPVFAHAADLPARKSADAPIPALVTMTWSGFYVGVHGGWQELRNSYVEDEIAGNGLTTAKSSHNSFIGGAKLGYDVPMGRAVYGVVADVDIGSSKLRWRDPADWGFDQKIRLQGSLRGRAGVSFGNALVYATGGLAIANVSTSYCQCGSFESFSDTKAGWTLGAGVEYALTKSWSTAIEYRYSDFGKLNHVPVNVWNGWDESHSVKTNAVRVGINYRFGS